MQHLIEISYTWLSALLLIVLTILLLVALIFFIINITRTRYAIRRNYPVIGRFRALFEHLGTFFRQYFFAMDREEMPFNRALRQWVYRAAKQEDNTILFGSTRDLSSVGSARDGCYCASENGLHMRHPETSDGYPHGISKE